MDSRQLLARLWAFPHLAQSHQSVGSNTPTTPRTCGSSNYLATQALAQETHEMGFRTAVCFYGITMPVWCTVLHCTEKCAQLLMICDLQENKITNPTSKEAKYGEVYIQLPSQPPALRLGADFQHGRW